jgi:hypothetical protein
MDNRQQSTEYIESIKLSAFADGASVAFGRLVGDGWVLPSVEDDACPEGFWIFALASWTRRVLVRNSDGSFWALETMA